MVPAVPCVEGTYVVPAVVCVEGTCEVPAVLVPVVGPVAGEEADEAEPVELDCDGDAPLELEDTDCSIFSKSLTVGASNGITVPVAGSGFESCFGSTERVAAYDRDTRSTDERCIYIPLFICLARVAHRAELVQVPIHDLPLQFAVFQQAPLAQPLQRHPPL